MTKAQVPLAKQRSENFNSWRDYCCRLNPPFTLRQVSVLPLPVSCASYEHCTVLSFQSISKGMKGRGKIRTVNYSP